MVAGNLAADADDLAEVVRPLPLRWGREVGAVCDRSKSDNRSVRRAVLIAYLS
jgi:hypothetical protein